MSRIVNLGYEYNDTTELGSISLGGTGAVAIVSATPNARTGTYCERFTFTGWSGAAFALRSITLTGLSEYYIRTGIYTHYGVGSSADKDLIRFLNAVPAIQGVLNINTTDFLLRAYRGDKSVLLGTSTQQLTVDTWHCLEMYYLCNAVNGIIRVWLNGTLVIDFTGNTMGGADTVLQTLQYGAYRRVNGSNASATRVVFDDVSVNNTLGTDQTGRCGGGGLYLVKSNGNGNSSQLNGSDGNKVDNYLLEDEVPPNITDYVFSSVVDEQDTYVMEDLPAAYNRVVLVQPIYYAALAAAGSGGIRAVVRSAGADDVDSSDKLLSTSWGYVRGDIRYLDPNGGAPIPWTSAAVNAMEVGPRVR